jgi:hypothetical protein
MFRRIKSRYILILAVLFSGFTPPALSQQPAAPTPKPEAKSGLRFICVSSLAEEQQVVLASRNEDGEWLELGVVELRSSFVTNWLPTKPGELHLALREGGALKSICKFDPGSARRALVVLIADPQEKSYKANVIDPEKLAFAKGSVLVINYSRLPGMVLLGSKKVSLNPGQREVAKPMPEANGMYRLMAAYVDPDKKIVPCYDRYVPANPESRDLLLLFPDPKLGLKVFSLPMFGEME